MTIEEILQQAKDLSPQEREELLRQLAGMSRTVPVKVDKAGLQIVATQPGTGLFDLVFLQITDPEKWMKHLRHEPE